MAEAAKQLARDGSGLYQLSPNVEIIPFDTTFTLPVYQVIVGTRRFEINEFTYRMLGAFKTPRTIAAACQELCVEAGEKDRAIEQLLIRNQIIVSADPSSEDPATEAKPPERRRLPLLRASVISQKRASGVTRRLEILFAPRLLVAALVVIAASYTTLIMKFGGGGSSIVSGLSSREWVIGVLLVYLSLFVHELGHSAACSRYGAKHGDIGIGIYFIWPVFYADVSDCWRLPRRHRVVIDLGGIYFQSLFSVACVLAWLLTGWPVLIFSLYCIFWSTVLNLNPFLRFDGYWVFTDALGVPRPWSTGSALLYHWLRRHFLTSKKNFFFDALPRLVAYALVVYSVLATAFAGLCIFAVVFYSIPRMVRFYPEALGQLFSSLRWGHMDFSIVQLLFRLFVVSMSGLGIVLLFWRLSMKGIGHARKLLITGDSAR